MTKHRTLHLNGKTAQSCLCLHICTIMAILSCISMLLTVVQTIHTPRTDSVSAFAFFTVDCVHPRVIVIICWLTCPTSREAVSKPYKYQYPHQSPVPRTHRSHLSSKVSCRITSFFKVKDAVSFARPSGDLINIGIDLYCNCFPCEQKKFCFSPSFSVKVNLIIWIMHGENNNSLIFFPFYI